MRRVVIGERRADLHEVVLALHASGLLARRLDGRQQERDQDPDDRQDHEDLDEREGRPACWKYETAHRSPPSLRGISPRVPVAEPKATPQTGTARPAIRGPAPVHGSPVASPSAPPQAREFGNTFGCRILNTRSISLIIDRLPVGAMAQSPVDREIHRRPQEPDRAVAEGEVGAVAAMLTAEPAHERRRTPIPPDSRSPSI